MSRRGLTPAERLQRAGFTPTQVSHSTTRWDVRSGRFALRVYLSSANPRFARLELGMKDRSGMLSYRLWNDQPRDPCGATEEVVAFLRVIGLPD